MGKKIEGYFVYIREYDLTKFDAEILKKYDLKKTRYFYIGSCNKYNMRERSTAWRNSILNRNSVDEVILEFIYNLGIFYKNELKLTDKEINSLLYYNNATVIERGLSKKEARELETQKTNTYMFRCSLSGGILLSNKAGQLKQVQEGDSISLVVKSHKKKQEFQSPQISINIGCNPC